MASDMLQPQPQQGPSEPTAADLHAALGDAEEAYAAEWAEPHSGSSYPPNGAQPQSPSPHPPSPEVPPQDPLSQQPTAQQLQQRSRPVRATRPPRAPDAAVTIGQPAGAQRPAGGMAATTADTAGGDGRARRAVANRQSAARSKERRRLYVEGLESSVQSLTAQVQEQDEHLQALTANAAQLGAANNRLSAVTSALDSQVVARAAEVAALRRHCAQLRAAAGQSPTPLPAASPPADAPPAAALAPAGLPPSSQPPTCRPLGRQSLTGQPPETLALGQSLSGVVSTEHAGAAVHGADAPGMVALEGSVLASVVAYGQQHCIPQPLAVTASQGKHARGAMNPALDDTLLDPPPGHSPLGHQPPPSLDTMNFREWRTAEFGGGSGVPAVGSVGGSGSSGMSGVAIPATVRSSIGSRTGSGNSAGTQQRGPMPPDSSSGDNTSEGPSGPLPTSSAAAPAAQLGKTAMPLTPAVSPPATLLSVRLSDSIPSMLDADAAAPMAVDGARGSGPLAGYNLDTLVYDSDLSDMLDVFASDPLDPPDIMGGPTQ